jgi:predicted ATP-grasp superfamily ATP-dependent carboligase
MPDVERRRAHPVLVLAPPRFLGPLGAMRSLSGLGAAVYGLEHEQRSIAGSSRFCAGLVRAGRDGRPVGVAPEAIVDDLLAAGRRLGQGTILLAGSDEWAEFLACHRAELAPWFTYPDLPAGLIREVTSKAGLHDLALRHGVATPAVRSPTDLESALATACALGYPVVLKPMVSRPDTQGLALVHDAEQLARDWQAMGGAGNVVLQEFVRGEDRDVWMFNGYFDADSRCLAGYTARKVRQHPARMGICTVGVCERNDEVQRISERFLGAIGYRGIVDIDYLRDERDGSYRVLDLNPRLGGAFRLMVTPERMDVARAMYLDLTGRPVPASACRDGRRWMVETADLIAFRHYGRDHGLSFGEWARSLRGVRETALFSVTDPLPLLVALRIVVDDTVSGRRERATARREAALADRS